MKPATHALNQNEREAAQAYYTHHAVCLTCQAAGRGYGRRCLNGFALWLDYSWDDEEKTAAQSGASLRATSGAAGVLKVNPPSVTRGEHSGAQKHD